MAGFLRHRQFLVSKTAQAYRLCREKIYIWKPALTKCILKYRSGQGFLGATGKTHIAVNAQGDPNLLCAHIFSYCTDPCIYHLKQKQLKIQYWRKIFIHSMLGQHMKGGTYLLFSPFSPPKSNPWPAYGAHFRLSDPQLWKWSNTIQEIFRHE